MHPNRISPERVQDLVALYLEGADHDVGDLENLTAKLREAPSDWALHLPRLRHLAHSIKGQGRSFGYDLMTRIGESLWKLLNFCESADEATVQILVAHVTAMRTVIDQGVTGSGGELGERLACKLEALAAEAAQS